MTDKFKTYCLSVLFVALVSLLAKMGYDSFHHYLIRRIPSAAADPLNPLDPGHYVSVLTLDDGSRVQLDSCGLTEPFERHLPDGTVVRLCYGSSIRYAPNFNGGPREVFLNGQASFDAAASSDRPFTVHTPRTMVRVLGTHFNVMDYSDEPAAEVTLLRGKVEVMHAGEMQLLNPLQQAIVKDRIQVRQPDHPEGSTGWDQGDPYLEFDTTDLHTVLLRVARRYRVTIMNPQNLTGIPITGVFTLRASLQSFVAKIENAESGVVQLDLKGDTIFLQPR